MNKNNIGITDILGAIFGIGLFIYFFQATQTYEVVGMVGMALIVVIFIIAGFRIKRRAEMAIPNPNNTALQKSSPLNALFIVFAIIAAIAFVILIIFMINIFLYGNNIG